MDYPTRKKNRLRNYDYSQNGAYFITICTKKRKCLLSTIVGAIIDRPACSELTAAGEKVEEAIRGIPEYYPDVHLEKYVIMPNHIHLLLMIDTLHGRSVIAPTISTIVRHMKGFATRNIGYSVFQKSFHDRVIRNDAEYDMIWNYIDTNPPSMGTGLFLYGGITMEEQFITAWLAAREKAARIGVRLRPLEREKAMQLAHRSLQGHRESEGFGILADKRHLELSLEALAVDKRFGALFSDEEANNALTRLLNAGYYQ